MSDADESTRRGRRRVAVMAGLGACAWLAIACVADGYVRHGYSATWYAQVSGERVAVARTTEHRVEFPNVYRPLARYAEGWPDERPRPEAQPDVDAELRASLEIARYDVVYERFYAFDRDTYFLP